MIMNVYCVGFVPFFYLFDPFVWFGLKLVLKRVRTLICECVGLWNIECYVFVVPSCLLCLALAFDLWLLQQQRIHLHTHTPHQRQCKPNLHETLTECLFRVENAFCCVRNATKILYYVNYFRSHTTRTSSITRSLLRRRFRSFRMANSSVHFNVIWSSKTSVYKSFVSYESFHQTGQ